MLTMDEFADQEEDRKDKMPLLASTETVVSMDLEVSSNSVCLRHEVVNALSEMWYSGRE
jgi:hypothetical protein